MIMNKYNYLIFYLCCILFSFCSVQLAQDVSESTTTTVLDYCQTIEVQYVNLSNELLSAANEFTSYIDDISPNQINTDREIFFSELDINYKYKEIYIEYLTQRYDYLLKIRNLLVDNSECNFPNDQSITADQLLKAEQELKKATNE